MIYVAQILLGLHYNFGNISLQELECADSAESTIGSFEAKFLSRFNPEEEFPPAEQSTPPRPI